MGKFRLNREQFNKWLRALKSGKYKQTIGTLNDRKGYCCLGVACKVIIPKEKLQYEKDFDDEGNETKSEYLEGLLPDEQKYAPQWLVEINDDFANRSKLNKHLSTLNDEDKYSFKQIAEVLKEAYPERKKAKMSTKKVLKKKK